MLSKSFLSFSLLAFTAIALGAPLPSNNIARDDKIDVRQERNRFWKHDALPEIDTREAVAGSGYGNRYWKNEVDTRGAEIEERYNTSYWRKSEENVDD